MHGHIRCSAYASDLVSPCSTILSRITGRENRAIVIPQNGLNCKTGFANQSTVVLLHPAMLLTFRDTL